MLSRSTSTPWKPWSALTSLRAFNPGRARIVHHIEPLDVDALEALVGLDVVEEDTGKDEAGALVERVEAAVDDGGVAARAAREVDVEHEQTRRDRPDVVERHARKVA